MASWLKYIIFSLLVLAVMVFAIVISTRHQTNVVATQEVDFVLQSADVGEVRTDGETKLTKKAIVSNLLTNIVKTHKEQGKNIQVNYVLLDTDGSKTTDEAEIDSVQFEVLLLGKNDRIESTSIQRVQLNEIEEG